MDVDRQLARRAGWLIAAFRSFFIVVLYLRTRDRGDASKLPLASPLPQRPVGARARFKLFWENVFCVERFLKVKISLNEKKFFGS